VPPRAPVRDVRILVHVPPDAVAGVLPHDLVAARFDVLLDGRRDVPEAVAGPAHGDGALQRLAGDVDQRLGLRPDAPHRHGHGRVPDVALPHRAAIDAEDLALRQRPPVRDAVHEDVVHGGVDRRRVGGVRVEAVRVTQERRLCPVRAQDARGDGIQRPGRDPGAHRAHHRGERQRRDAPRLAQQGNLLPRLHDNGHRAPPPQRPLV